ncbi:5'-methylthioadenosine/adenosylhomocysteine nucleosidase [Mycolicibacterium goodii]|uniref:5'-methylthioadenosine/adenosylhomocysteine nucleosidase n=1 Tax=Mycolicibacterium goodii TaxID=134601 RepID=UPI001F03F81A|nr:5'-methylthioadenosine/adenosylhomocysteine nucleosidase [Mycolicibacterium goodii]ULN49298.1 5'-methylthioadenosine/adenosylhomocysteine nucleosidase [Mycolicibacterium goodii]
MTIGLICALPQELVHLRDLMSDVDVVRHAHTSFETGTLDGREVVVAGTGMGKVNAALVTTLLIHGFGCRTIIFSGVAGGLDPELNVGDVIVAERVVQHDAGVIENEQLQTYQAGHVPFINPTDRLGYDVDAALLGKVRAALEGLHLPPLSTRAGGQGRAVQIAYGTVLSGDQYLHSAPIRDRLHAQFGGRAVEMEGGAVAQVAEAFDAAWLVIRALSDLAGEDSRFEFDQFAGEVAAASCSVLRALLPVL